MIIIIIYNIYCPELNTGVKNILTRTNVVIIEDVLMSDCLT